MFTGIIEKLGEISALTPEGTNLHIDVRSEIAGELKVDQSVAHNGICLTVIRADQNQYRVTAIAETLSKTNIKHWKTGGRINLERAMISGGRLDGQLIPLGELADRIGELDRDAEIIVHCKMGVRSANAVQLLRDNGFDKVFNHFNRK